MKLALIDIAAAYDAAAPFKGPLGGTQAAVCYLARALAAKGHAITLINQLREGGMADGVQNRPPEKMDDAGTLQTFDAIIINGRWTEKLLRLLRKKTDAPFIAWMHEAAFNDPWALPAPELNGIVFVSNWQAQLNAALVPPATKSAVIKNGVAPPFHGLFANTESITSAKESSPIIAYVGSSKRGLLRLPEIIPTLHTQRPDVRFAVYGDCIVGHNAEENAAFQEKLQTLPNMVHAGGLPQDKLAAALKKCTYLMSPNTYPETFCIALAEGMAAGCLPIITQRAALPETAAGFAALVPIACPDDGNYYSDGLDTDAFARAVLETISAHEKQSTEEKEQRLREQIDFVNQQYCWEKHTNNWVKFIEELKR